MEFRSEEEGSARRYSGDTGRAHLEQGGRGCLEGKEGGKQASRGGLFMLLGDARLRPEVWTGG